MTGRIGSKVECLDSHSTQDHRNGFHRNRNSPLTPLAQISPNVSHVVESTCWSDALTNDPHIDEKMKNLGLPQGAIEHAMVKDGVDPALYSKISGGNDGGDRGGAGRSVSTMPPGFGMS